VQDEGEGSADEVGDTGVKGRVGEACRSSVISSWVERGSVSQVSGGERLISSSTIAQASGVDGMISWGAAGVLGLDLAKCVLA
jgi:hypothetical protein